MFSKKNPKNSTVPSKIKNKDIISSFPIVGIGASAGGLSAFESFFSTIPKNSTINMAFVLIQHLDPNHESMLSEIIQKYTTMNVYEAKEGMIVHPNCVYIIPPKFYIQIFNGALLLSEPPTPRTKHLPIDFFLSSLAQDQHKNSRAVILSGTGTDGSLGIKSIKEQGGIVFAQDINSAEFDGMPKSAIETGSVDIECIPSDMYKALISETFPTTQKHLFDDTIHKNENTLLKIFALLREQTSHDFSMYKPNTIGRRIDRRMSVHNIKNLDEYYKYLQQTKNEVNQLFKDLLIGVTNFFRDSDAFLFVEEQTIPQLFSNKISNEIIRIWVTACSTGEEAYSLAILIAEYKEKHKMSCLVQIFATDIDARAIATARRGIYPASITEDVSKERLEKYFTKSTNKKVYHINKYIRDMLIFSVHNTVKDPPFSNMDLISCRNLLIYMNIQLQEKLISSFHYALKKDGVLFLGSSESLGTLTDFFSVLDHKSKVYQCKKDTQRRPPLKGHFSAMNEYASQFTNKVNPIEKIPLREITEQAILGHISLCAILVNNSGDILYVHGRTGIYFELPSGEIHVNNILKLAREGLQEELILAFKKVKTSKYFVSKRGLRVKCDTQFNIVNLNIRSIAQNSLLKTHSDLYLLILEEATDSTITIPTQDVTTLKNKSKPNPANYNLEIQSLKTEVKIQKEFLQDANEKLRFSNEEFKSYNEEIQSMYEELQSTNEELETSKEELQSVNEELSTVNAELHIKVNDLSRANNDMNNLLAGTEIGTVFVDHSLCILRFTPAVIDIINFILGDLGRPLNHIMTNLINYDDLVVDVQKVLDTLIPIEHEVKTKNNYSYLMKIQPYRTLDNVIEGAVISFFDITEIVIMREELQEANKSSRLAVVVRDAIDAITVHDMQGKILAWNPGAQKLYGWSEEEALQMNVKDRIPKNLQKEDIKKLKELSQSKILESYKTKRLTKDSKEIEISVISSALYNEQNKMYAISTTERALNTI